MRNLSAPAFVLDVVDLHERDRIVSFLTAEWGKKRGVARGARAKYSRFAGQLQPLAKVQVSWFEKEGRDLVRLNDVSLLRPSVALQTDLEGILLGCCLAEHMMEFAQENEASDPFFRLLDTTLQAIAEGVDRDLAARYYEIWVLRLAGIFPPPRECPLCGRDLAAGATLVEDDAALVCRECAGPGRAQVSPRLVELLRRSAREKLARLAEQPPTQEDLAATEKLCTRVRRSFLQHELKSYRVMRETLAGLPAAGDPAAGDPAASPGGQA